MSSQHPPYTELNPTITTRVHNKIKLHIAAQRFPVVVFKSGIRATQTETVKARTLLVRPQQTGFLESRNRGCGGRLQDRNGWIWVAIIHFDRQVDLDTFEDGLLRSPLRIPRDSELTQQIDISMLDATYEHPPENQPSHGTRVTYRFQADLTPL